MIFLGAFAVAEDVITYEFASTRMNSVICMWGASGHFALTSAVLGFVAAPSLQVVVLSPSEKFAAPYLKPGAAIPTPPAGDYQGVVVLRSPEVTVIVDPKAVPWSNRATRIKTIDALSKFAANNVLDTAFWQTEVGKDLFHYMELMDQDLEHQVPDTNFHVGLSASMVVRLSDGSKTIQVSVSGPEPKGLPLTTLQEGDWEPKVKDPDELTRLIAQSPFAPASDGFADPVQLHTAALPWSRKLEVIELATRLVAEEDRRLEAQVEERLAWLANSLLSPDQLEALDGTTNLLGSKGNQLPKVWQDLARANLENEGLDADQFLSKATVVGNRVSVNVRYRLDKPGKRSGTTGTQGEVYLGTR